MAKYWVGGTGNTNDPTNHWATSSGGAPGAGNAPTGADDIFFDVNSGTGTITINAALTGRSLQTSGSTVTTCVHSAAITVTLGDATAGASNKALDLSGFSTYTLGNAATSAYSFVSSSSTQQTVTTNAKVLGNVTFVSPSGGTWLLADDLTLTGGTLTVTRAVFNTNSKAVTAVTFLSSTASTRTLTFGASQMTFTTSWSAGTITGLTVTANTATTTITGVASIFASGLVDWNGLSVVMNGSGIATITASGAFTLANFTRTATAVKTDSLQITTGPFTVTSNLTLTGQSVTNRLLVRTNLDNGVPRTITAGSVTITNVDFMDITGAGAAAPWTGTSLGNALGNSGITFDTPVTQTWSGTSGGNWSTNAWTTRVPLPQDNVVIASAFISAQTILTDMPRLGATIDWTGTTWSGTAVRMSGATSTTSAWYGSLIFVSGMGTNSLSGNAWQAKGRGTYNIDIKGVSVTTGLTVIAPGGTYNLQSSYSQTNSAGVLAGTYNTNNFNISVSSVWAVAAGATCNFGTSTITFASTTLANVFTVTGTVNAASATFVLNSSTINRIIVGGNQTYGTLTYTAAGSTGSLTITGNNTFGTINFSDATNARLLQFTSGTTNTIGTRNIVGTTGKLMTVSAVTPGLPATLLSAAAWLMGSHSVNVSGNTGLTFAAGAEMDYLSVQDIIGSPLPSSSFLAFF